MTRSFLVPLTLPADPATALEAATKQYVDNKAVGGAGAFFQYTFSTTLTAPPASGSIRYNNATPASVTTIYVHYVTNDSTDTKTRLLLRQAGDKLYLQDKDASATYHIFRLTATPTDNGTYAALTVVFDSGAGTFGNNQLLLVGFLTNTIPDGDKGDITTTNSGATWTIDNNAVTTAKLADVASGTIRGRVTAGTGDPQDLTGTQATSLLDTFTTAAKGLVPSPGSTSGLFLKDDGTWAAGGSGGGGSVTGTKLSALAAITGALLNALDLIEVLDVSDGTMGGTGTNKKITMTELVAYLNTVIAAVDPAGDTMTGALQFNNGAVVSALIDPNYSGPGCGLDMRDADGTTSLVSLGVEAFADNVSGRSSLTLRSRDNASTRITAAFAGGTNINEMPAITLTDGRLARTLLIRVGDNANTFINLPNGGTYRINGTDVLGAGANTLKGNNTGSAQAYASDLTAAQAKTLLAIANTDVSGLGTLATKSTVATADITNDAVDGTKLANMPANTVKGNNTGSSADPLDLTVTQSRALLAVGESAWTYVFSSATAAPPATGTVRFNTTTTYYVNVTTADGINIKNTLANVAAGLRMVMQNRGGTTYAIRQIQSYVDNSTYLTLNLAVIVSSGTFTDGETILFSILPAQLATQPEVAAGSSISLAVTPQGAGATYATKAAASETVSGIVELATAAETLTGTDNVRAVHPLGLAPLVSGGGPLFGFLFNTATTTGTSTSGLRLDNATPASATTLYVNYVPREGIDLKVRLLAATAGDRVHIQDRASSANYRIYEVTGAPTDLTTYASLPVVHRLGAGSLWANGAAIVAGFTSPAITIGTSAPTSPLTNDIWIDTT